MAHYLTKEAIESYLSVEDLLGLAKHDNICSVYINDEHAYTRQTVIWDMLPNT